MTSIRVSVLGGLRIERDGQELRDLLAQPVRCAIFVYLAVERRSTRDALTALFWPERDADRARHSLSQTLYELRRGLGDAWIRTHGEQVEVTPAVTVDALDVMAAVAEGRDAEALAVYRGPFLDAIHLGGTREFESWVDRWRSRLERIHGDGCRRLVDLRVSHGDVGGALAVARQWADADAVDDQAQHRLIELLAAAGRRTEALRQYEAYEACLARELEVQPPEETAALVAGIRDGEQTGALDEASVAPPAAAGSARAPAPASAAVDDGMGAGPSTRPATGARAADHSTRPDVVAIGAGHRVLRGRIVLAACVLAVTGLAAAHLWRGSEERPRPGATVADPRLDPAAVAVLPFVNLSPDTEQEYFSDGITEDLLTSLSRIEGLRVTARTSVMRFKGSTAPIAEIARELGVGYVLEGSVRREADQVRITAQLIDAATETHVWAETYDRELTSIFRIQSDIADRIAQALAHRLSPDDRSRIAGGGTGSIGAYDLVLRGRAYLNRPGAADIRKYEPAMDLFRRALEVDPGYARAHAGLSEAFRVHVGLAWRVRRDSARYYARRAVDADPSLPEALTALGGAYALAGDRARAEDAFSQALDLDPNRSDALAGMARVAWLTGRLEDAVRWSRRALEVDPAAPYRLANLAEYLLDLGDLSGAEVALRRAAELAPDYPQTWYLLAQIHHIRGDVDRAEQEIAALTAAASDHPGTRLLLGRYQAQRGWYELAESNLSRSAGVLGPVGSISTYRAYVATNLGQPERAAEQLRQTERELTAFERDGVYAPRLRLEYQVLRGDRDGALAIIERYWRTGLREITAGPQVGVYWLDADPLLESLRDDARFRALMDSIRTELDGVRARIER